MAQAIDLLNDIVREELPAMLVEIEPEVAPLFSDIKRTSMGVKTQDGLGKGYQVIHIYNTGLAGAFESADPLGPGMTSISGNQAQILALGTAETNLDIFPSAQSIPHTGEVKRTLTLHKIVGNYSCPVEWKQLDTLNAAQLGKINRDLRAVARQKVLYEATSFFSHEADNDAGFVNQVLGRINTIAEWSAVNDYVLINLDETFGRIANFGKGQLIDIVATSGATLQDGVATDGTDVRNYTHTTAKYVHLVVSEIDYLGKNIVLRPINSDTGGLPNFGSGSSGDLFQAGQAGAANDWLVVKNTSRYIAGSRPQYSWGMNSWIKSSGSILGGANNDSGLDVDIFGFLKSQVKAVNGPLTDTVLNGYIAGYLDSFPGTTLDTIITTQGVNQKFLEQPGLYNNRQNYERTGKSLKVMGGWSTVSYEFGGRVFNWVVSPMCLSKTLYACKFGGDNIKRYSPPRIGGMNAEMGPELNFLAELGGHTGVFKIAGASSGASTNLLEAPFWYHDLVCPIDPRAVKLTGLTESTMY